MTRARQSDLTTPLTTGDYVLILPEDVAGRLELPSYARVVRVLRSSVELTLTDESDAGPLTIPRPVAEERRVPAGEATGKQPGTWLRKAVRAECNGAFHYGQVVGYDDKRLVVKVGSEEKRVALDHRLEEVYPVIAMVMGTRRWWKASWPVSRLKELEDRLFETLVEGEAGGPLPIQEWVREWARYFGGLSDLQCQWVDPASGNQRSTSLLHVVRFAFYVDGHRNIPPSLHDRIGTTFCDDPNLRAPGDSAQPESEASFFDPLEDDDHAARDGQSDVRPPSANGTPSRRATEPRTRISTEASNPPRMYRQAHPDAEDAARVAQDIEVIELIRQHRPHLLEHYISNMTDPRHNKRRTSGDYPTAIEPPSKRVRAGFQPSSDQEYVHRLFTAEKHQGKSSETFLEYVLASPAAQLYTHPGVVGRLYDLRFGRGLSIKHFRRIGFLEKLRQMEVDAINASDYTVAAPVVPAPTSWAELGSATRSFVDYCRELCDPITIAVAEALDRFVNALEGWQQCDASDLPLIVTWIDSLLDRYRKAATYDTFHLTSSRSAAPAWFSVSNPELHTLMITALRERLRTAANQGRASQKLPSRDDAKPAFDRRIPSEVAEVIPKRDGNEVCLHYLSKRGCKSSDPDKCTFKNRVHFWPKEIPSKLRQYIATRLGGLRKPFQDE